MKNIIEFLSWFAGLVILQVLLFNNIQIAGVINRISLILAGFILGLVVDVFSNTWGIHAMATTLIAFLRPYVLNLFFTQEEMDRVMPRFRLMGGNYINYIVSLVFNHHLVLFFLEAFSFSCFWLVLLKVFVSSLITILLILMLEKIRR